MEDGQDVTTSSVEDNQVQDTQSTGNEAVTNSEGEGQEQSVPFDRFQEVNNKAKSEAERAAKYERELEELRQQQSSQSSKEDEDIDPNVSSLVKKIIEKEGYVKKDALTEAVTKSELARQYREDTSELTVKYAKSGVPFNADAIRDYAKENGINITSKASLEAAYRQANFDKILESRTNAAITQFKENGGKTTAEKPGSKGATPPVEKEVTGSTAAERIKSRIGLARQKVS